MGKNYILLIEDNPDVQSVLVDMLATMDFDVDAASSGSEALLRLGSRSYDVVITDMRLPGMDAIEIYEHIACQSPELLNRFIFTTGETVDSRAVAFLQDHADRCIYKPFRLNKLREVIALVLDQTSP